MSPRRRAREWLVLNARPASDLLIGNVGDGTSGCHNFPVRWRAMSDSVIDLSPVAGGEALDALVPGRSIPLGLLEPPDMWLDFADGAVVLRLTAWVEPATASAYKVEPPNGVYVTLALGGVRFEPLSGSCGDMPSLTALPGGGVEVRLALGEGGTRVVCRECALASCEPALLTHRW